MAIDPETRLPPPGPGSRAGRARGDAAMTRQEYRQYLKSDHWQSLRQWALDRYGKCLICGETSGLDVHHNTYDRLGVELPNDVVVLCRVHHMMVREIDAAPTDEQASDVSLLNEHHFRYLRYRSLDDATIAAAGFRSASADEVADLFGCPWGSGLLLPYPGCIWEDGSPYYRLRPDRREGPLRGNRDVWITKGNEHPRLYIPFNLPPEYLASSGMLWITDGEIRALFGNQHGFPFVGLPGAWAWQRRENGAHVLLPEIAALPLEGRDIQIHLSDTATEEAKALSNALKTLGAYCHGDGWSDVAVQMVDR